MNSEISSQPAQKLKAATAGAHSKIEGGFPVMRDNFSLENYRDLLSKLYGFYLPLEVMFSSEVRIQNWIQDYGERQKLKLLEADLNYFGFSSSRIQGTSQIPLWFQQPTKAQVLGIMYVLEGSTLGGQIISKHLKNKFQFPDSLGTQFFTAYGPQTGLMWKRFQTLLNEQLQENSDLEEGIWAANSTFEHLGRWLQT